MLSPAITSRMPATLCSVVLTDMGGPNALITTEQSVAGMREVIAGLSKATSGRFYAYDGQEIPW